MSDMKKCDGCGATIDVSEEAPARTKGWATVEVQQEGEDGVLWTWTADACPSCAVVVHKAMNNKDYHPW